MNTSKRSVLPWATCFDDGNGGEPVIQLSQTKAKEFVLGTDVRFIGTTAFTGSLTAPRGLQTDLASVPKALRWFVSPYGIHTPAALVHDNLIGETTSADVDRVAADRLFREMLDALGVPLLRRWLMWAAVALGTRWDRKGTSRARMVIWAVLAVVGMVSLGLGLATMSVPLLVVAAALPFPAAVLWGKQYVGGLIAAASGPWLFPPAILATIGYGIYWVIEKVVSLRPGSNRSPASVTDF